MSNADAYSLINSLFETTLTKHEWTAFLIGAKRKTVLDVCEFVAARAQIPVVTHRRILGKECLTAGAFDCVQELLKVEGVGTGDLAPSTALISLSSRPLARVIRVLTRVRPSMMDEVEIIWPPDGCYLLTGAFLLIATLPAALIAATWPMPFLSLPLIVFGAFVAVWHWSAVRQKQGPDAVTFKSLKTVADLCRLIAGEPPSTRRRQST